MRATAVAALLLPILASATAAMGKREMPGCRPGMPCYHAFAAPVPCGNHLGQQPCAQKPAPAQPSILPGSQAPESGWRSDNHNAVSCQAANDCTSYCKSVEANDALAQKYGVSSTCVRWAAPGSKNFQGRCACGSSQVVGDMLLGLGDMICIAADVGVNGGLNLAAMLVPYVGPEIKAAENLFKLGKQIIKQGSKNCGIEFCPGHQYTVVDPNQIGTMEGVVTCL